MASAGELQYAEDTNDVAGEHPGDRRTSTSVCPVDVWVRVRAALASEDINADPLLAFDFNDAPATATTGAAGSTLSVAMPARKKAAAAAPKGRGAGASAGGGAGAVTKKYRNFASVFGPETTNAAIYERVLAPCVARVLRGETVCAFAYGHTGSGKTHTIVGYGDELGMYRHSLVALAKAIEGTTLQLQVRCAELYQGKVYDLLAERAECFLREDASGQVHIRGATQMDDAGRVSVHSLRAVYATRLDDLVATVQHALASRAVGQSNLHAQSSRSHALIELQLVTPRVVAAREAVLAAEADLVPVGKARDTRYIEVMSRCYTKNADGTYVQNLAAVPQTEHDALARMQAEVGELERAVEEAKANEQAAVNEAAEMLTRGGGGRAAVAMVAEGEARRECGTLVFVDLAGSEYASLDYKGPPAPITAGSKKAAGAARGGSGGGGAPVGSARRSTQELAEGKEINRSLLSLKECMRALATGASHVPFRNSKLTLLLRRYLQAEGASAAMIATVAPAASHAPATANTLQYAALLCNLDA